LTFFVAVSAPRGSSVRSSKTLLPFSEIAVITHCSLGLRSGRLRGAVFHNARSLRGAQNAFAKHLKIGAECRADSHQGFAAAETVPALLLPHRLRFCFVGM
jgi:hypothetical protein